VGAIYQWDFADGAGTTLGNPVTKSYAYHNTYNVILNIIYKGTIIYTCSTPIRPYGIDATPVANFQVQNTSSTATTANYFFNNSSTVNGGFSNVQWDWDFGDSTTLSTANSTATRIYNRGTADKTYTVKMMVTANSGCSASKTTTITIPKQ
jgi:PKD repeat protein